MRARVTTLRPSAVQPYKHRAGLRPCVSVTTVRHDSRASEVLRSATHSRKPNAVVIIKAIHGDNTGMRFLPATTHNASDTPGQPSPLMIPDFALAAKRQEAQAGALGRFPGSDARRPPDELKPVR